MKAYFIEGDKLVEASDIDRVKAARAKGTFVWVDLETREQDAPVLELFDVHRLTVDDVFNDRELPKVEDFGHYIHIIAHSVAEACDARGHLDLRELDIVLGESFIITHEHDRRVVDRVREELERNPRMLKKGACAVAYALLDRLVDDYVPLMDWYDEETARIESDVMDHAGTPRGQTVLQRILALKRGLQKLRRTAVHQRELLLRLARGEFDEIPEEAKPFFRDVHDHFARVTDLAESYRDLLVSLLEAYLSVQSNRMNEVMKTLTLISTIMLPLTFIAGVYGMNFDHMPELHWKYGYAFALSLMAVVAAGSVIWFKTKQWL